MVACRDGNVTGPFAFSPFTWGRWLKPFSAEVVSSFLNTAEVLLSYGLGIGIFFGIIPDCSNDLGSGIGFLAETVDNRVAHGVMCGGGSATTLVESSS